MYRPAEVVDCVVTKADAAVCAASAAGQVMGSSLGLSWVPSESTLPQAQDSEPLDPSHWIAQLQVVSYPEVENELVRGFYRVGVHARGLGLPVTQMSALQEGSFHVRSVQVPRYETPSRG